MNFRINSIDTGYVIERQSSLDGVWDFHEWTPTGRPKHYRSMAAAEAAHYRCRREEARGEAVRAIYRRATS